MMSGGGLPKIHDVEYSGGFMLFIFHSILYVHLALSKALL